MKQEIWFFQKGFYAVHVMDTKLKHKFDFLKNIKQITAYSYPSGVKAWDFLLPAEMYKKVVRMIKNKNQKGA
jgi:hypothetical protein